MKKAFDITIEAIANLSDAINLLKSEMTVSDSRVKEDLQKTIFLLDEASTLLVDAVIVFEKYVNLL